MRAGRLWIAGILAMSVAVGVLQPGPAQEAAAEAPQEIANAESSVVRLSRAEVRPGALPDGKERSADGRPLAQAEPEKVDWPSPGEATLEVPAPGEGAARVGSSAVAVTETSSPRASNAEQEAAKKVSVRAYGPDVARRLGGHGTAFRISRADGVATSAAPVGVRVDVSGFADAFGGNFESRLRLLAKPACALTTPEKKGCAEAAPVPSHVDLTTHTLVADVTPAPAPATDAGRTAHPDGATGTAATGPVFVVAAAAQGETGSATATTLSSSSKWSVGLQSGDFSWSLPLPRVPAIAGEAPEINLGYSSQAVDGMVAAENNQPSWVGQGWSLALPFIERKYNSCVDDDGDTGDLCWSGDELRLSLQGTSSALVKDEEAEGDVWRARRDPGWRVERHRDADNADNDGEYWVVTTPRGTKYIFGRGEQATTGTATDSVYTVPVYGDDSGEPCHDGDGWCTQAWRWNLDRVVDAHGNSSTYFYEKETNRYAREGDPDQSTDYVRGGYLRDIVYSQRSGAEDTQAPARLHFDVQRRCIEAADGGDCPAFDQEHASSYPDVPMDTYCTGRCTAEEQEAPTFFTGYLLRSATAQRSGSDGGWVDVDRMDFTYSFPEPSDGTSAYLWLERVQQTGLAGPGERSLPPVEFTGTELSNRADADPEAGAPEMRKLRISSVVDELGRRVDVGYGQPDPCPPGDFPPAYDSNAQNCFPGWRTNGEDSGFGVWHKYLVTDVTVNDTAGGSPPQVTEYRYRGDPAWHFSDSPVTPNERESWSDWRGYGSVDVVKMSDAGYRGGDSARALSLTRHLFFRGMHGDRTAGGGTKSVEVTDSQGTSLTDWAYLRGKKREQRQFALADSGQIRYELGGTVKGYTSARVTPAEPGEENPQDDAHQVVEDHSETRETVIDEDGGRSTRVTRLETTYDSYGQVTQVRDIAGSGEDADRRCTEISYARDDATVDAWMVAFPYRVRSYAGGCDDPAKLIRGKDQYYDGSGTLGGAVRKGDVTRTVSARTASAPDDVTDTVTTKATFDRYGRTVSETDARGNLTTTEFSPATGRPSTVTETNPLGQAEVTTLDPDRQQPVRVEDANGQVTRNGYDALGRLASVHKPEQDPGDPAAQLFSYRLDPEHQKPPRVRTKQLQSGDTYLTTWSFLDSLGRQRQTQEVSPGSTSGEPKTIVTGTRYDDAGRVAAESLPAVTPGQAGSALLQVPAGEVDETRHAYDSLNRKVRSTRFGQGERLWTTTTEYFGDHTRTTPPEGGVVTAAWTDPRGRKVRQQEGTGADQVTTRYTYTPADKVATVTDPEGHRATYDYDLLGRRVASDDPDSGRIRTRYDGNGNPVAMWDAKALAGDGSAPTLTTEYDKLNRPVARWAGRAGSGTKLSTWTYDSESISNGIGRVAKQTTHQHGRDFTVAVTGYDPRGRVTGKKWTFPEGLLSGLLKDLTYSVSYGYDAADHMVKVRYHDSIAGAPKETITTGYDDLGNATTLRGRRDTLAGEKTTTYVSGTGYAADGKLATRDYANPHHELRRAYAYEPDTQRLSRVQTLVGDPQSEDVEAKQDDEYSWDPAGNLTSVTDRRLPDPVATCFTYDGLNRVNHAWTTRQTDCSDADSTRTHDGPAGYNQSWTYSPDGNITSHRTLGGTRQFEYEDAQHPHAVTESGDTSYSYDANGAMKRKVEDGILLPVPSSMRWDAQHRLASVTKKHLLKTRFVYAPDGTRLARVTPSGTATLYIDGQEITLTLGVGLLEKGTRFYQIAGTTVAERVHGVLKWQFNNPQGSAQIYVPAGTSLLKRTYYNPYGKIRHGSSRPATDHGFLGKVKDPTTGLNALGARYYDADLGRFISTDPAFDTSSAQTINAYSYGANNPLAYSDPTGLFIGDAWDTVTGAASDAASWVGDRASDAAEWASNNKGLITDVAVGIGVGIGVGALCSTGVGCLVVAGVAGGVAGAAAGYGVDAAEGKVDPSLGGFATRVGIGGAAGVLGGVGGKVLGAGIRAARGTAGKQIVKAASSTSGKSVANTAPAAGSKTASVGGDVAEAGKTAGRGASQAAKACSFAAPTAVLMANGETKPISEVEVGDKVLAADPKTGERAAKKVTKVWKHKDTVVGLDVAGKRIATTEDHPFWNVTDGVWQRADQLDRGDKVRTAGGRALRVDGLRPGTARQATAYNLTVQGIHTYHVGAGDRSVLVHNTCGSSGGAANSGPSFIASADGVAVPTSRSRLVSGFDEAGFAKTPTTSAGTQYTLPDGSLVRVMEPSGQAPLRASFTNAKGGPVSPFTGKPVQPPPGLTKAQRLDYIRLRTHVELGP